MKAAPKIMSSTRKIMIPASVPAINVMGTAEMPVLPIFKTVVNPTVIADPSVVEIFSLSLPVKVVIVSLMTGEAEVVGDCSSPVVPGTAVYSLVATAFKKNARRMQYST